MLLGVETIRDLFHWFMVSSRFYGLPVCKMSFRFADKLCTKNKLLCRKTEGLCLKNLLIFHITMVTVIELRVKLVDMNINGHMCHLP